MDRARRAAVAAIALVFSLTVVAAAGGATPSAVTAQLAAVSWPASTLVVSEVQTGGASASDEFVEIANQGPDAVDLVGLEVAYVTSTGGTVTRKASWAGAAPLAPGQRVLLANALGAYAAVGDVAYSGGLAATGGAIVLRPIGGAPIDAVGWGDATNAFVEGAAAPAPAAGSSIERRPGGIEGNGVDTNDNRADWVVQSSPSAQNLSAPPVPAPIVTPTPTPTSTPTPMPTPTPTTTPTPTPTPTPSPSPTPTPTSSPTPNPSPTPTSTPTPTPSPTSTPTPTTTPTPTPTPSASPSTPPLTIADARALPDGTDVTIRGVLTTGLGALESGRTAFVEDDSSGIALYLDAAVVDGLPVGTAVIATGTLDTRYAQRTLRVALADLIEDGRGALADPPSVATGDAGETVEGRRIAISGLTVGSPSGLADGTALTVDDGSGQLRVIVTPAALGELSVPAGTQVAATGPVGQRDSSGTGTEGYRLYATEPGEFAIVVEPSPSPSSSSDPSPTPGPSASPSPIPSPSPTPTPSPSPSPSSTPSASPGPLTIAAARTASVGRVVTVRGVVTAEAGRLGTPPLIAIEDSSAGIMIRLPDGAPRLVRGTVVEVTGSLAAPYGQTEIRPSAGGVTVAGSGAVPAPLDVGRADVGESTEGLLVAITGRIERKATRATSGDVSADLVTDGGTLRLTADASSGLTVASFRPGTAYRIGGIVGQHASRKGALDGYRIWLRDAQDLAPDAPAPSPSPTASGSPAPSTPPLLTVVRALLVRDRPVSMDVVVTAGPELLDASGRRVVVQDATAAVEVLVPADAARPALGDRLRVTGTIGRAYGAARVTATSIVVLGRAAGPRPMTLSRAPGAADDWRLVRIAGTVVDVKRLGDRWRAEIEVRGVRIPVSGLPGSGVPSTALVEGRSATVTGIVKRAYPSATDTRFAIVPRFASDVALGPSASAGAAVGPDERGPGQVTEPGAPRGPLDVDLARLADHAGQEVRVGGLLVDLAGTGFTIDDGTAVGRIALSGEALAYLPLLEPGDALNVVGRVARSGEAVEVADPAGLFRVGDLGEVAPIAPAGEVAVEPRTPGPATVTRADFGGGFGLVPSGPIGMLAVVLMTIASTAFALARRERRRRLLASRVGARLARLAVGRRERAGSRS